MRPLRHYFPIQGYQLVVQLLDIEFGFNLPSGGGTDVGPCLGMVNQVRETIGESLRVPLGNQEPGNSILYKLWNTAVNRAYHWQPQCHRLLGGIWYPFLVAIGFAAGAIHF